MVLLLFGPPGCGKSTQSRLIIDWFRIPPISTGEMLRAEMKAGTKLGRAAQSVVAAGGLVGNDLVNSMLERRIANPDCGNGFRSMGIRGRWSRPNISTDCSTNALPSPVVLHLEVQEDTLVGRMTSRRQCPKCSRVYNLLHQPPTVAGMCDDDGAKLITRKDDQEIVFRERLPMYDELTRPVREHYQDRNYFQLRGDYSPTQVFEEISRIVEKVRPG